jgi:signal transduction histidine kinase
MSSSPAERRRLADPEVSVVDALYRISSLTAQMEDPREALEIVIDEIIRVLPASSAAIELINPDTQLLEIEVFRGFPEHSKEVQLRLGQGVTGWVALHGRPLLVPDVREDSRYIPVSASIRCELAVPMLNAEGSTIGVVNIDSEEVNAFDERDRKVLTLLTNEASRVVGRLWMIKKLREQAEQLRALVNTGRSIVRQRETGELLQSLTAEALTLMQCRVSALYLYDPKKRVLTLEALAGIDRKALLEETLALEESALGTAVRRRKTVELHDLVRTEEHHFVGVAQRFGLVSGLSTPIMYENEVIGLLNAYHDSPHRFSNSERRAFETLAGIGASAIQNARLYSRIFQSEESLRRTERLTTLGLLSAEIAHEIRNPLTVIRLLFDALDLQFPEVDPRSKDAEIIREKIDQLEAIVSRVLSFGKSREDMKVRLDLRQIVADTLHLVRLKLQQSKITLQIAEPSSPVMVEASRGQLQQALLNLVINATQAMPAGGAIRVAIEETDEGIARIDLTDTGSGVPDGLQHEIFESFLTGRSEGTGLGLAIVKRILRSHHGDVELLDTSGAGTTMRIWLPAC